MDNSQHSQFPGQWMGDSRTLAGNPFISAIGFAGELSVAFTTARRAFELQGRMEIAKLTTEAERDLV